jgi:hypothetical protein
MDLDGVLVKCICVVGDRITLWVEKQIQSALLPKREPVSLV